MAKLNCEPSSSTSSSLSSSLSLCISSHRRSNKAHRTCSTSWLWNPLIFNTYIIFVSAILISSVSSSSSSSSSTSTSYSIDDLRTIFSSALLSKSSSSLSSFSSNKTTSTTTLGELISLLQLDWSSSSSSSVGIGSRCFENTSVSVSDAANCVVSDGKCVGLGELSDLYHKDRGATLTPSETEALSPALLYHLVSCKYNLQDEDGDDGPPSSLATWGYSFLLVTIINLLSITGALVLPCMKFNSYRVVLMFLVALAVGTLAGSGLLFLIPEAFELDEEHNKHYSWKSTTVMGGIYLFFLLEKLLRKINDKRENTRLKKQQDEAATAGQITSSFTRKAIDNAMPEKNLDSVIESMQSEGICSVGRPHHETAAASAYKNRNGTGVISPENGNGHMADGDGVMAQTISNSTATTPDEILQSKQLNGFNSNSHHHPKLGSGTEERVAPVAYMIIFGDALHNFIDGLSIGSAFTKSIMTGISISVAVMCEELPHELGDFAILLNSGMRIRKALCYNFLSATTCYLGTFIGILLGENTQSHAWIFALAGGMFLYISLVDMLPEMNAAAESPEGIKLGATKVFIIQNLGLLSGFGIMLIFAIYGHNIHFE